jgi:hypothetical protein
MFRQEAITSLSMPAFHYEDSPLSAKCKVVVVVVTVAMLNVYFADSDIECWYFNTMVVRLFYPLKNGC